MLMDFECVKKQKENESRPAKEKIKRKDIMVM